MKRKYFTFIRCTVVLTALVSSLMMRWSVRGKRVSNIGLSRRVYLHHYIARRQVINFAIHNTENTNS